MTAAWERIGTPRTRIVICSVCRASTPNVSSLLRGWQQDASLSRRVYRCADCRPACPEARFLGRASPPTTNAQARAHRRSVRPVFER
jgi:hypothetical protein